MKASADPPSSLDTHHASVNHSTKVCKRQCPAAHGSRHTRLPRGGEYCGETEGRQGTGAGRRKVLLHGRESVKTCREFQVAAGNRMRQAEGSMQQPEAGRCRGCSKDEQGVQTAKVRGGGGGLLGTVRCSMGSHGLFYMFRVSLWPLRD